MWNGTHTKTYNLDGPNYNKMPIYNLLCYFVTRVVHDRIMVTWDKGVQKRLSLFGLFLNVLVSWSRDLSLYDWFCSYSALFGFISFIYFMLV